jgi:hypothetical protein
MSRSIVALGLLLWCVGCSSSDAEPDAAVVADFPPEVEEGDCELDEGDESPHSLRALGCRADFDALASEPLDSSIPGARSVKVVFDQLDPSGDGALYFQNSVEYPIHHEFAFAHLSGGDLPIVSTLAEFNETEYSSPERRFILGAVTFYEGPGSWALEISPYDSASPEMITSLYRAVRDATYFGPALGFHPTSESIEDLLSELPGDIDIITSQTLYDGIDYQPLNLGTGVGRLRFVNAAELADIYLSPTDLVVLDKVPNDITVVAGLITGEFQTPLSHVNVLAQNRKTPNMGLREAPDNEKLRALEGEWVQLEVGAFEWTIEKITRDEADAFYETHGPEPVTLPAIDMSIRDLRDIEDVVVREEGQPLRDAIVVALAAFGGKAAHFSVMAQDDSIPMPVAFAVPAYYYVEMMETNGFHAMVEEWLEDPEFRDDPLVRDTRLKELRDAIMLAPVNEELQTVLRDKLESYEETRIRFRTSTNSEDLEGFPCAGCYESHTGDRADWNDVLDAIRETWGSIWLFRTFEERTWYKVDHTTVTMALLVHPSFPDEEANGVALTANPFDPTVPAFYVNVQFGGDYEVVHPPPGVTSDELIYSFYMANQPERYISHSNVLPPGQDTVLNRSQLFELGRALDTIHDMFKEAYGPPPGSTEWYAMDVEFKLDGDTPETAHIVIKQARPHPGRGE